MTTIASNLQAVRESMALAARESGRAASDVTLLAVSKTFSASAIRAAFQAGQTRFAESYVQEAQRKLAELHDLPLEWHFIGPIQSNKTRVIAENFSWVHSVDRLKIAERLSEQRPPQLPPLQICLQINISAETSKSGVTPEAVSELAHAIAQLPHLQLRGLMTIPAPSDDITEQRAAFAGLRELQNKLIAQGLPMDTLSMGMSHDFPVAIAQGATFVRVGSAIFGNRNYSNKSIG